MNAWGAVQYFGGFHCLICVVNTFSLLQKLLFIHADFISFECTRASQRTCTYPNQPNDWVASSDSKIQCCILSQRVSEIILLYKRSIDSNFNAYTHVNMYALYNVGRKISSALSILSKKRYSGKNGFFWTKKDFNQTRFAALGFTDTVSIKIELNNHKNVL